MFELLKTEEKKLLINFFNLNKNTLTSNVQNKLRELENKHYDFNDLSTNIINIENGEKIYKQKIVREITKINEDRDSFRIDYLTVMLVGQSGVGKSTLINQFLKLKGRNRARTGTGTFVTTETHDYRSDEIPFLRLIDTRGIEININYGAAEVKNNATAFIRNQLATNNINNFVSCIWYCITGDRFQQVEIDLLNALRSSYEDNTIPIIIVYTQAVDEVIIDDMSKFIKEQKIKATFIKVLAEGKKLTNKTFIDAYGLDDLLKETLDKCKKAIQGDMRAVMANNISEHIKNILIKENSYIRRYINEVSVLNFVNQRYAINSDSNFEKYVIDVYENNIQYFLEKGKEQINERIISTFRNSEIFNNNFNDYKSYYEQQTQNIIAEGKDDLAIQLLDLQVKTEKNNDNHLFNKNKRTLDEFKETTKKFLQDNFYCIAQKSYILYAIQNISKNLSLAFENRLNDFIRNIISHNDVIENINKLFIKKFNDFEERIKNFIPNFNTRNYNPHYYVQEENHNKESKRNNNDNKKGTRLPKINEIQNKAFENELPYKKDLSYPENEEEIVTINEEEFAIPLEKKNIHMNDNIAPPVINNIRKTIIESRFKNYDIESNY